MPVEYLGADGHLCCNCPSHVPAGAGHPFGLDHTPPFGTAGVAVGKSTVCLLLHEAFKKAGKSVAIQDWDAQGTSSIGLPWARSRPRPSHHSENRHAVL